VAFRQLFRLIPPDAIHPPATLHSRACANFGTPALQVAVFVNSQELGGVV
jgi:hypothetical protein